MRLLTKINHSGLRVGARLAIAGTCATMVMAAPATAQLVSLTKLSNVPIGTIGNLEVDQVHPQNVCAYSSSQKGRYSVKATGSGSGGAFSLMSGTRSLNYEVQWSSTAGATTGVSLTSGTTSGGFTSNAKDGCTTGPTASASLIVVLRSASLAAATAGDYSGTLTIMLAAE